MSFLKKKELKVERVSDSDLDMFLKYSKQLEEEILSLLMKGFQHPVIVNKENIQLLLQERINAISGDLSSVEILEILLRIRQQHQILKSIQQDSK